MTRLSVVVIAALAGAGCYNPAIAPCQLACANGTCPDGLACNTQNACAATSTSMCDELPIDAPGDSGNGTKVTIEVRDRTGAPLALALVVFVDSAGAQVAEMPTGFDGLASVDMLPGGSATVIRSAPRPNGAPGSDIHASTYLDLWPGAHIISMSEPDQRMRTVTFEIMPPPGTSMYTVYTTCSGYASASATTVGVAVPLRCPMFDAVVVANTPTNPSGGHVAVLPGQTATSIVVPTNAFKPVRNLSGLLQGLPTNTSNRFLGVAGWASLVLPASTGVYTSGIPNPNGLVGPLAVAMDGGLQTQMFVAHQPMPGGPMFGQIVLDRLPVTSTSLDRDYNNTLIQWAGDPTFEVVSRKLSWPFYVPVPTTPTSPTLFSARATYNRDPNMGVVWRISGDASRITTTGATQSITFPDVPGTRMFEPIPTDVVSSDAITLIGVEAQAAHEVRQILESEGVDYGYFKIPALRHVTISVGN